MVPFAPLVIAAARPGTLGRIPLRPWDPTTWVRGRSFGTKVAGEVGKLFVVATASPFGPVSLNEPEGNVPPKSVLLSRGGAGAMG